MSKFFKALQQAEQDRRLVSGGGARASRGRDRAEEPLAVDRPREPEAPELPDALTWPRPKISPPPPRETPRRRRSSAVGRVEEHLVSLLAPRSYEADQYRALRYLVEERRRSAGLAMVAVTSPTVRDGKTTTAINLAGALAQGRDARVLLVDADLRRPTVADHLGLRQEGERGLTSVILDAKLSLEHVIQRESHVNMTIVTAGPRLSAPFEALKSQRLVELFAEARQRYEYIVVDTPPVVHVPDCQVISQYVDGFLMVVAAHATPRKLLEEALNTMDPAKMVGLVFNGDNRPLSGYYAHYYHATRAGAGQSERWQSAAKRVGAALRGRSRNGLEDGDAP